MAGCGHEQSFNNFTGNPDSATALVKKDWDALIRKAFDALPSRQRMIIILKYYEGLSQGKISRVMGTTAKDVERLLGRTRKLLQSNLSRIKNRKQRRFSIPRPLNTRMMAAHPGILSFGQGYQWREIQGWSRNEQQLRGNKDHRMIMNPYIGFDYSSWGINKILMVTIVFLAFRLKVDILWVVLAGAGMSALIL